MPVWVKCEKIEKIEEKFNWKLSRLEIMFWENFVKIEIKCWLKKNI